CASDRNWGFDYW
nr:immunoglobulin heavy chain junction region [Macaca mulatta]MPN83928.1 immunoglobulin heavy chain junction region [Macaca mulatta]MPN83935.1 immunoglobulin heavy chain junction region [Macaca mulatta]MPN84003.1 immunoglobulin heavy chain junction region [Macaca mulatta]MPN84016.1 immunoglobulin heavy chain junction region [Macaca mulatta]